MSTTSLKASKQVAHSPSKAETVLSDNQKLAYAPMVALCAKAYGYELDSEKLTQLQGKANLEFASNFVNIVRDNDLDYPSYMALKKHTIQSIATAKHIEYASVEKWFNPIIKGYIKNDLADGYELPKSETKNAEAMTKLRSILSAIPNDKLQDNIVELRKATDSDSLKQAAQYAKELEKRKQQAENALRKTESKAITEKKTEVKQWITSLDLEGLAAILYVKNHFSEIKKLAKITK
jgi:hypothetical protein